MLGAPALRAEESAPLKGLSVRDMDVYYSERLDMVNLTGRVLDLRDILLSNQEEDLTLPRYTWLPNYTVRLWLQAGPKGKKLALNELALMLDTDFFDNEKGIITLRHRDLGVLAEVWYGGKGIWGPTPTPPAPSASVLIPFDRLSSGAGGVPPLPPLPMLGSATGAPPAPPAGGSDFEYVITGAAAASGPESYNITMKSGAGGGAAALLAQAGQARQKVDVVVSYATSTVLPPSLSGKRTITMPCTVGAQGGLSCGPVWLPQSEKATAVALCSVKDPPAAVSSANPMVGNMLAGATGGAGGARADQTGRRTRSGGAPVGDLGAGQGGAPWV